MLVIEIKKIDTINIMATKTKDKVERGTISISTEDIFPIIKRSLYSDQEIFLRELVSNAVDATQKLKVLSNKGEYDGDLAEAEITVSIDKEAGTLTISDRGLGMDAKEIKKYITINIIGSLFSLLFTSFLIFVFGLIGALYAIVINQSVIFFVTLYFVVKSQWFHWRNFNQGVDKENLFKLGGFSLMAITSAVTGPVSQILVRNHIGSTLGWDAAGYWQGVWYISSIYLMVVTTPLALYYLPRLSEIIDNIELKKEIFNGYIVIIPIVSILALIIYFSRELVIHIAFTDNFMPMLPLFKWQLIGDVIKIVSWLLSYLLLAKAMTKLFICTEIGFSISFVVLSISLVNRFGLVGVTYAFSLNYLLYLIVMVIIFRKKLR